MVVELHKDYDISHRKCSFVFDLSFTPSQNLEILVFSLALCEMLLVNLTNGNVYYLVKGILNKQLTEYNWKVY